MPKIRFNSDYKPNGGDVVKYHKGRVYNIEPGSVERWVKRGHDLVPDTEQADEVVEAQLDAGLAVELEKDGKGTHAETEEAIDHAVEVAGESDDDEEEFEDADEEEDAPKSSRKKKSSRKSR